MRMRNARLAVALGALAWFGLIPASPAAAGGMPLTELYGDGAEVSEVEASYVRGLGYGYVYTALNAKTAQMCPGKGVRPGAVDYLAVLRESAAGMPPLMRETISVESALYTALQIKYHCGRGPRG
jgi:hypothetical protein